MDGSGKTTLAKSLMEELKKRGIPSKYVWCRWFPGLADPFHFIIRKTLGYTKEQYNFLKPLKIIYEFLLIVDYAIWLFLKVRTRIRSVLIIDRYVYDALTDLYFLQFNGSSFFRRLFIEMNPKPDITFLIDVPLHMALLRRSNLSLKDARKYKKIYNEMAKIYGFQKIINVDFRDAQNKLLKEVETIIR
jgi:thymidylate kinase